MAKRRSLSFAILGILALALLLGGAPSWATTPSIVSIHGQLLDASGQPLTGNRAWQLRFFSAQTGGEQLGTTLTGTVTVSAEGVFDIPVSPPQEALLAAQPWYELAVDGTPTPNGVDASDVFPQRVAVYSVPFALEANHVAVTGVGAGTVNDTEFSALDGITGNIQSQFSLKANTADVYTKTAADAAIAAKANAADVYTKAEVDASLSTQNTAIAAKANTADVYTKTQVDASLSTQNTAIAAKANTADVYTKTQVDASLSTQDAAIAAKANAADVYTKGQVDGGQNAQDAAIATKANAADVYTKAEVDSSQTAQDASIAAKASTADVYTKTEVDGKQFSWTVVNGDDVQAVANHGYVVTDAVQRSVVLPASDSVAVGDIIRVTGAGAGGWRLAQNGAQQVLTSSLQIQNTSKDWLKYPDTSTWRFITASSDGKRLAACVSYGQIQTSTDSGATWTPHGPYGLNWRCIASSTDGQKLVAGEYGGKLHTSADFGATWTEHGADNYWLHLACSGDGTIIYAATNGDKMYVSTDSGITWTQRGYADPDPYAWSSVAASSDGTKAVSASGGSVLFSTDSGETWTKSATAPYRSWEPLAASDDLTKIVVGVWNGSLFTSTDSGATWNETGPTNNWVDIACSSDGTKFIAVAYPGQAYMSTDSGATWKACAGNTNWFGVTASDDFSVLAATAEGDGIYRYSATVTQSTSGAAGALSGGANTAVELQYIGGDTFMPISHEGTLGVN